MSNIQSIAQATRRRLEIKHLVLGLLNEVGKPTKGKREIRDYNFFIFTQSMPLQICKKEPYILSAADYKRHRKDIKTRKLLEHYLDTLQLDIELTEDNKYILTPTNKLCEKREAYKQLFNINASDK